VGGGAIPLISSGYGMGSSFMLSASALANSGVHSGPVPAVLNWQMHVVLLPLAILGGLGSVVLIELVGLVRMKGELSAYSKTVLAATAWVYIVLFVLLLVVQAVESDFRTIKWIKVFASSSALAID